MDRLSSIGSNTINASKEMTATVMRQFCPSRVERQLLAQVFELICGQRCERTIDRKESPVGSHTVSLDNQVIELFQGE